MCQNRETERETERDVKKDRERERRGGSVQVTTEHLLTKHVSPQLVAADTLLSILDKLQTDRLRRILEGFCPKLSHPFIAVEAIYIIEFSWFCG